MNNKQKLTWIGKNDEPKLEPLAISKPSNFSHKVTELGLLIRFI
jgi:hypothetical protein